MLTVKDLETLARYGDASSRHVLSVYLDVDQSRESNLNRGYLLALREMLRSMESKIRPGQERQDFLQQAAMIQSFVSNHEPTAPSLVYFSDGTSNPLGNWSLHMPLRNNVYWGFEPCLRPLLEALDEGQHHITTSFWEVLQRSSVLCSDYSRNA